MRVFQRECPLDVPSTETSVYALFMESSCSDRRPKRVMISADIRDRMSVFFSDHQKKGRFFNPWAEFERPGLGDILKWQFSPNPHRREKRMSPPLQCVEHPPTTLIEANESRVTWLGHASFLVSMDNFRVVIDPIFGHMGAGLIRRRCPAPRDVDALGKIDAICITHGHYDHLDKPSVARLASANPEVVFCVPLGMASILPSACRHVLEFDWWDELTVGEVTMSFVPAQHWYRRGAFDLNRVLWGGWIVTGSHRVYHSGDTGFFRGFEAIGAVFNDIDVAILPLGAYEPAWFMGPQHMRPEESVQAFELLGARHFLGMHWGTFDLSDEPLDGGVYEGREAFHARGHESKRFFALQPGGTLALSESRISADQPYEGRV